MDKMMTNEELTRFAEALNTIEELLPVVRQYLQTQTGGDTTVLNKPLWDLIIEEKASLRLQNTLRKLNCITPATTVGDFTELYTKVQFLKTKGCGKKTFRELDEMFKKYLIDWNVR